MKLAISNVMLLCDIYEALQRGIALMKIVETTLILMFYKLWIHIFFRIYNYSKVINVCCLGTKAKQYNVS
jgi:hypothetical protein